MSRVRRSAAFDRSRCYRYTLTRCWDASGRRVAFIMLNPNRADAVEDDPTIRRCMGFARSWGFGSLEAVNLFSFCAPRPSALRVVDDPVGRRGDLAVRRAVGRADRVVAAWGAHGTIRGRERVVRRMIERPLWCLGTTKDGHPRHPLYVPARQRLLRFRP